MTRGTFSSASGLRPTTAFFGVGIVLTVVLVRAAGLCLDGGYEQPRSAAVEHLPSPDFDIVDRRGRTLARSVKRLDLEVSPRAMWQAHTPDYMAGLIAETFADGTSGADLLPTLLPDAPTGVLYATGSLANLDFDAARQVRAFVRDNSLDAIWLERAASPGRFRLVWRPIETLARETRERCDAEGDDPGPLRWTRKLSRELALATGHVTPRDEGPPAPSLEDQKLVWSELMPSGHAIVAKGLTSQAALDLHALLDAEGVHAHQMSLRFVPERRYPVREPESGMNGFEILGNWRYIDEPEAVRLATLEFGLDRPSDCPEDQSWRFDRRVAELLERKHPRSGLEGLCAELLAGPSWSDLQPLAASYRFRLDRPVHQPARRYYMADAQESDTPRVVTTLDSGLQSFLRQTLEGLRGEHMPAIAMAIAVELDSGDVLAVDGLSRFDVAEFLPTWHLFTPGSTFKVIVMATGLDAGVVQPQELFDTHDGQYFIPGSRRLISEAEGPPGGWQTASAGLAHSINAVMTQIGMRIPAERLHATLRSLGYGSVPETRLGVERAGMVPALPWKPAWAHASISFGHELQVSLWQHATGLASVLRGGVARPLRVTRAVECDGESRPTAATESRRVLSLEACEEVRRMMVLGAQEGTGDRLWNHEQELGTPLLLATKTGTAEKVPSEVCLHLELERNELNRGLKPGEPGWVGFDELKGRPRPHARSCYTSSICVLGSIPGEEREVMVLVVVDEPRGRSKFGSDVAGPAALAILKEALGLTRAGELPGEDASLVPEIDYSSEQNPWDQPWEEQWEGSSEERVGGGGQG